MPLKYRVIQWSTGFIGANLIRAVLDDPAFELVGVYVHSADKNGRDVGELIGRASTGIIATSDKEEIFALDADVVFDTPRGHGSANEHDDDILRFLENGVNVISSRAYFHPQAVDAALAAKLETACRKGSSTVFATGINPGFVGERLAATLSGICQQLDHMTVVEAYDCSQNAEATVRRMGFGMTEAAFKATPISADYDEHFGQTLHALAAQMGGRVERIDAFNELILAQHDIDDSVVPVARGCVSGIRKGWTAIIDGRALLTLEVKWFVEKIPDWPQESCWTVQTRGKPALNLQLAYDDARTPRERDSMSIAWMAGAFLNAVPAVITAPPGILRAPVFAPYSITGR
jgi:hypothetical protein